MTETNAAPITPYPHGKLRVLLAVIAAIETTVGVATLSRRFSHRPDLSNTFGEWIADVTTWLAPVLAFSTFVLALGNRLPRAIITLAAMAMAVAIGFLSQVATRGLDRSSNFATIYEILQMTLFPPLAVAAILLAQRDQWLGVAGVLASMPTVLIIIMTIALALAIRIHGL
jgi:hypothetical protein